MPSTVSIPGWLVSTAMFDPHGRPLSADECGKVERERPVRFLRKGQPWRPSVSVLDLTLAVLRLDRWDTRPDNWEPYTWRSLALAMMPSLEGRDVAPPMPGGFHQKYSAAFAEAEALMIQFRREDGEWSDPEPYMHVERGTVDGRGSARGARIQSISFARPFERAIAAKRPAALHVSSYFELSCSQHRIAFILGTAAAAHSNVSESSPAKRLTETFLAECGYAAASFEFRSWTFRLCERLATTLHGKRLASGAPLSVEVWCNSELQRPGSKNFAPQVYLRFWAGRGTRRNVSPLEADMRRLLGDAMVESLLKLDSLQPYEEDHIRKVYVWSGRNEQSFARDRGFWNLSARLFGRFRPELTSVIRNFLEEHEGPPRPDFKPALAPRDPVRVAVSRIKARLKMCAELLKHPPKT